MHQYLTNPKMKYVTDCAVNDCSTVEEFAHKYRKQHRFTGRGKDYVKCVINSHYEDIEKTGYTAISEHDNITGKFITFIPNGKEKDRRIQLPT